MTGAGGGQLITDDWRIRGSVYRDDEIFAAESRSIFGRCWVYLAHESEVPANGDYKATWLGTQPVVVTRGADDGEIRVLFNRCRHRGAQICQEELGNSKFFRCAYHGWTYANTGKLVGVPFDDRYGDDFDKSELGLVAVPRVDSFAGFIFACLDEDAPDLAEYLGNARPYIEAIARGNGDGIELTGGSHRLRVSGNWKLQVENTIDSYHFSFVHLGYLKILARRDQKVDYVKNATRNEDWRSLDLGNGHSALERGDLTKAGRGEALGIGDLPFSLIVFPNLSFVGSHVRVIQPRSARDTAVRLHPIFPIGASDEQRDRILRSHELFYGPQGAGYPDDVEVGFDRVTLGLAATAHDRDFAVMSRGLGAETRDEHGRLVGRPTDELTQRAFYRRWRELVVPELSAVGD